MKKNAFIATVGTATLAASADAGFLGFVIFAKQQGGNVIVDVYAAVGNASDKFLNVFNTNATTTAAGGFFQATGLANKAWKPDAASFSVTRNSIDSFMTAGIYSGGAYGDEYYPSTNTTGDPNFTGTSWSGNPVSAAATTIPANAGWYTADPTSVDNQTQLLAPLNVGYTRFDSGATAASGNTPGSVGSANATYGIWCSHIVIAGTLNANLITGLISWSASASIKDGVTSVTDQRISTFYNFVPPDTDNDGIPNASDNCPTVANPTQADCNNNGIGEACENFTDCNRSGKPDSCDIAAETSLDGDSNGVPDECEVDCNHNGISDLAEIFSGSTPDGNTDLIPDVCQGAAFVAGDSGNLGPPSGYDVRTYTFTNLLYAANTVTLTVDVRGDLNGATEYINISLNGGTPQRFFEAGGNSCPSTPDRATITLTKEQFRTLIAGTNSLTVTMTCPITVDPTECKGSGLTQFKLNYLGIDPKTGDCNGNNLLDLYETNDGTTPDCDNNNVPDSCDIGRGGTNDCNLNGVPDACEISADPSIDCDQNGAIDTCELATLGTAVDCDQNGRIDSCQVAETSGIDCNANLKPDSCDIASGLSMDRDANGEPDECQTVQVPSQIATIQAAIDSAPSNKMRIIMVAPGTYAGPFDFKGKPVIVHGTSHAQTILSGSSGQSLSVVRFTGGEPPIAALERVTVRGGASGSPVPNNPTVLVGGAIFGYNSAASVRDCFIENNAAGFGGGAYFLNCTGSVTDTVFRNNSASADGGGLQVNQSAMNITDVVVESNVCNSRGGGMHLVQGTPTLTRVTVRNNQSSNLIGGVSWFATGSGTARLVMNACSVTGNTAAVTQGGLGISETLTLPVATTLQGTTVCNNTPRPNVTGRWTDLGGNTICDCVGDLNVDGVVNGADLGLMLSSWGPCGTNCPYDLNADGQVNGADLGLVLSAWGVCGG
jgi:hypothetical protein